MISRADKVPGERLRGEASPDMIRAYKYCQHDSRDELEKESLLSDGEGALGGAAGRAGGVEGIPRRSKSPIPKPCPAVLVPISVVSTASPGTVLPSDPARNFLKFRFSWLADPISCCLSTSLLFPGMGEMKEVWAEDGTGMVPGISRTSWWDKSVSHSLGRCSWSEILV